MGGTIDFLLNCGSVEVWWLVYSVRKCGVMGAECEGMVTRVQHGSMAAQYEKVWYCFYNVAVWLYFVWQCSAWEYSDQCTMLKNMVHWSVYMCGSETLCVLNVDITYLCAACGAVANRVRACDVCV